MGSPSPLYMNMQQQQHSRQVQSHLHQVQQIHVAPSPLFTHPLFPTSFAPPPTGVSTNPSSFPSNSFVPPQYVIDGSGMNPSTSNGLGQVFGVNGPPTMQFGEREERDGDEYFDDDDEEDDISTQVRKGTQGFRGYAEILIML